MANKIKLKRRLEIRSLEGSKIAEFVERTK